MNPSGVYNDEGLPSPPLDEGVLFSSRTTMELSQVAAQFPLPFFFSLVGEEKDQKSDLRALCFGDDPAAQFFDGMDDDGSEFRSVCLLWFLTFWR